MIIIAKEKKTAMPVIQQIRGSEKISLKTSFIVILPIFCKILGLHYARKNLKIFKRNFEKSNVNEKSLSRMTGSSGEMITLHLDPRQ